MILTPDEEKFVNYWAQQRLRKKDFLKKFSIGLPIIAGLCVLFFANFLSGWYGRADNQLRKHSSLLLTILIAVVIIAVFVSIFSVRHKWDRNEADYQTLLNKKSNVPSSNQKDLA